MPTLPVTIFTGFLGSGKTTLLASLLAAEHDTRFAIVVNEFGEVSVDDVLLQQARGAHRASVFKLTRGLIAYAGDDFTATMLAISDDARLFDHVLVETSGLAVPTAVLEALHSPALQDASSTTPRWRLSIPLYCLPASTMPVSHSTTPPPALRLQRCFSNSSCALTSWS